MGIGLSVVFLLVIAALVYWFGSTRDDPADGLLFVLFCAVLISVCAIPFTIFVCRFTSGLNANYSDGERIGFVTKTSNKGIIWKTNEIQIQVGTGEMAALQEPHPLSVPSAELMRDIESHIGRKGKFHYREWLIMPYYVGDSGYEVTSVEWIGESE